MTRAMLSEYQNKHIGEDIYVLASGKSYDYFPSTFFDNRITIGVNQMSQLRSCNYAVRKEIAAACVQETLSNEKTTTLFLSIGSGGSADTNNLNMIETYNGGELLATGRVVMFSHAKNVRTVRDVLPTDPNSLVVSWSTITTAIHLAAHMGARAVYVVGHDCGTLDGETNCSHYHTTETMKGKWKHPARHAKGYPIWLNEIEKDTAKLRTLLMAKYGCHVVSLSPFVGLGMEGHEYRKHRKS